MTVVHFLHQTDIGLALHKHKAIYSISPTLFSPSHSLSLSFSLSCICISAMQTAVWCQVRQLYRPYLSPFSFSNLNLFQNFSPSPSPPSNCSFPPLSHLHPPLPTTPAPHVSPPLSVCVFLCSIVLL